MVADHSLSAIGGDVVAEEGGPHLQPQRPGGGLVVHPVALAHHKAHPGPGIPPALHHGLCLVAPTIEDVEPVGKHGDVVIHHPEPLRAQLEGATYPLGESTGSTGVLLHGNVDRARRAPIGIGLVGRGSPVGIRAATKLRDDVPGLARVLVVNNHNAPGGNGKIEDGVKRPLEKLLAHVRHDDDCRTLHPHPFHNPVSKIPSIIG